MKTFILANLLCVIAAFPLHDRKVHFRVRVSQLWTSRQLDSDLHRAIQCAERYGLCDVDELLKLAEGKRAMDTTFHSTLFQLLVCSFA